MKEQERKEEIRLTTKNDVEKLVDKISKVIQEYIDDKGELYEAEGKFKEIVVGRAINLFYVQRSRMLDNKMAILENELCKN